MLTFALCDDQPEQLRALRALVEKYLSSRPQLDCTVELFSDGDALLRRVESSDGFDIYILDILMPRVSGITVGQCLRRMGAKGKLIYLTNSNDFAAESYETDAFFYLLKPPAEDRLFCVLDNAVKALASRAYRSILVETRNGAQRLALADILYAERSGRVMRFHCTDGLVDSQTLRVPFHQAAAPLLADPSFCLCGASFVLNFRHVTGVNGQKALLDNGRFIALPRTSAADFKKAWGRYWLKEDRPW